MSLTAHELARKLLAGPDLPVWVSTDSCCGCRKPTEGVLVGESQVVVADYVVEEE